ncbi:MAG: tetratricopeptide repeat protein [Candidatus Obscuribacterales bacterium]
MPQFYSVVTKIGTSISHRAYALVRTAYALFAVVFIYFFVDSSWFSLNLSWFGLPIILLILGIAHLLLLAFESDTVTGLCQWLKGGTPAIFYRTWLNLEELEQVQEVTADSALWLGRRQIRLAAIESLELTFWGNLMVRTDAASGPDSRGKRVLPILARLPVGAVDLVRLKEFVEKVQKARPDVAINRRLEKRLASKIVRGEEMVKLLGAVFLLYVLLDLGFSTGFYLEMLKDYHLARKTEKISDARRSYAIAERMRLTPMSLSLVHRALFERGSAASGVWQARAEALWDTEDRQGALESIARAQEYYPQSLRLAIERARWLAIAGRRKECREILEKSIEKHDDSFLPRLYMLVLFAEGKDVERVRGLYKQYCRDLDEDVFGEEPWWPPGGDRFLSQRWYREDMHYLMDRLLP